MQRKVVSSIEEQFADVHPDDALDWFTDTDLFDRLEAKQQEDRDSWARAALSMGPKELMEEIVGRLDARALRGLTEIILSASNYLALWGDWSGQRAWDLAIDREESHAVGLRMALAHAPQDDPSRAGNSRRLADCEAVLAAVRRDRSRGRPRSGRESFVAAAMRLGVDRMRARDLADSLVELAKDKFDRHGLHRRRLRVLADGGLMIGDRDRDD